MTATLVSADRVVTSEGELGDALVVSGGKVAEIGRLDELRRRGYPEESHPGATIIPGLRDAHFHPVAYTTALHRLTLKKAKDIDEVIRLTKSSAAELPAGQALIASRLDDENLAERRLPTRHDLDHADPSRPMLLHRYCGHIAVANTAALKLAGIGPDIPDPPGGSFDRDEDGRPNGILRETAVAAVGRAVGRRTRGIEPDQLLDSLLGLARLGLTSIGAMVSLGMDPWCGVAQELDLLIGIADELPLKVGVMVIADAPDEISAAADRLRGIDNPRLRFLGFKAFGDGSLGGHTAAMRRPYADQPGELGTLRLDHEWAVELARRSIDEGGTVALHAIGDLANEKVLDVFERLIDEGSDPGRMRVEHASVLTDEDITRFVELGVTASVQPAFIASETGWLEKRVGADRLPLTYPFATLERAGIPLAGGSDCPVEPPDPVWGMASARDRAGIVPEESLSPESALDLFTGGAARVLAEPTPLGEGSPADFVVLDTNPLAASANDLRRADVVSVWIDGRPVDLPSDRPDWPG